MYHIAVIGAGQLGSRHLQGLSHITVPSMLYLVDLSNTALDLAQQRLSEMPPNDNIKDVICFSEIANLPKQIDLVILATTANVRFMLLERLLVHSEVKNIVLEKVLFQQEDEYERAGDLLKSHGVKAWVNCPRRLFEIYRKVRDFFCDHPLHSMQVYGGDWGLGCNGIHFADLFHFLSGKVIEEYDASQLDSGVYPGKRTAFVEFGGTLIGRFGAAQLWLTAMNGSTSRHLIMLRAEKRSCLLDEQAGQAWFMDEQVGWNNSPFTTPYQSQMTGDIAMSILQRGNCDLPDYPTSAAIHLPFIRILQQHLSKTDTNISACPIT
ncbi:MAG: Gfo/Idh/MocA family oxidoreductase [Geobacteraceae bacterium]|nr:Gfo/Idh/MocA family oxidoreductase [Geobacteraceae bacterium]NTW79531.1 Gfo/Idh/MocA family oxidoreductase [Geobacteraceae bacterium]